MTFISPVHLSGMYLASGTDELHISIASKGYLLVCRIQLFKYSLINWPVETVRCGCHGSGRHLRLPITVAHPCVCSCCLTCVPAGTADCQHTTGRPLLPTVETGLAGMPHGVLFCSPNLGPMQGQTGLYHSPCLCALQPAVSVAAGRRWEQLTEINNAIHS